VHPAEPSWYLGLLGVDADRRSRGLGSALLRDTLAVVDLARQPAYLEATSPRNRVLYERHGFRHLADVPLPGGPTAYAMWRDPAAASR
jgi:GNAT superfamily N-acetyltransferase